MLHSGGGKLTSTSTRWMQHICGGLDQLILCSFSIVKLNTGISYSFFILPVTVRYYSMPPELMECIYCESVKFAL